MTAAEELGLTAADEQHIEQHGLSLAKVEAIVAKLGGERRYVRLGRAATARDGVVELSDVEALAERFDALAAKPGKFTPMSGAASRMFGFLGRFLANSSKAGDADKIERFIAGLDTGSAGPQLPFGRELERCLGRDGHDLQQLIRTGAHRTIVEYVLEPHGLAFRGKPKAVIPFHLRDGRPVTPLEEHIKEALAYAGGKLHITISAEHEALVTETVAEIRQHQPALAGVDLTTSTQHPATDSVAIDAQSGELVRDGDGRIAFFPAGHGSLLRNIGELGCAVVVRNVDNVPKSAAAGRLIETFHRAMAVLLADIKSIVAEALQGLAADTLSVAALDDCLSRLRRRQLRIFLDEGAYRRASVQEKRALVRHALDRPIKIVGVVPNEGEPGGGPFVIDHGGFDIVSIVEKDEIAAEQKHIMQGGEFFNPVDLLVDPTDVFGRPYDLAAFVNTGRHFIVRKPYRGREVIRLEHPGLWNGAMDGWSSLFVSLPIETFAPVKEVVDLLRPQHQQL